MLLGVKLDFPLISVAVVVILVVIAVLFYAFRRRDPFLSTVYSESFNFSSEQPDQVDRRFAAWLGDREEAARGGWNKAVDVGEGIFRLSNDDDAADMHLVRISPKQAGQPMDLSNRTVAAYVRIMRSSGNSAAGVIYRCEGNPASFYAFTVSPGRVYTFALVGVDGKVTQKFSGTSSHVRTDGWNRVGIVAKNSRVDLYVNGAKLRTIDAPELSSGCTGVIAMGGGLYEFDNMQIFK